MSQIVIDHLLEGVSLKESSRLTGISIMELATIRKAFIRDNAELLESLVGVSSLIGDLLISQKHIEELNEQINLEDNIDLKTQLMKRRAELLQLKQNTLKNPILAAPVKQTMTLSQEDHQAILGEASPEELERIQAGDAGVVQSILQRIKRGRGI